MAALYLGLAAILLLTIAAGLARILRGPTVADSMLAAQLFGTTGVAMVLMLAQVIGEAAVDVALVFALLAALSAVAFARRAWRPARGGGARR